MRQNLHHRNDAHPKVHFMKNTSIIYYSIVLGLIFVLQACTAPCNDYIRNVGSVNLSVYDSSVFYHAYQLNQTIKYVKNKKDTLIFNTPDSYYSEEHFTSPNNYFDEECGTLKKMELQNHGIYIYTPSGDSTFYLYTQTIYDKDKQKFTIIKPKDSLSILTFGFFIVGHHFGQISINADKLYMDDSLLNNLLINGGTFNNVYYNKNLDPNSRIKEIYFHPVYGAIKFSFFKPGSPTAPGDEYEILL